MAALTKVNDQRAPTAALLQLFGIVFGAFVVVGMAMPVVPLYVHDHLGMGTFVVGLIAGGQFASQLASRVWAGRYSDTQGTRATIFLGLVAHAAAGFISLISLTVPDRPALAACILLLGRIVLGVGGSFVITGAQALGLSILGPSNAGKVMSWIGMATYAGYILGAPAGTILYGARGFAYVAVAMQAIPLAALLLPIPPDQAGSKARVSRSIQSVVAMVWVPGLGLVFASFGVAAMMSFVALLFRSHGWAPWGGFTAYAVAFLCARLLLGHLPDRAGGGRVAMLFATLAAGGQFLLWWDVGLMVSCIGAVLSGFGMAMVYPGLGVEAVRRVPTDSGGLALSTYTAFSDLAIGVASPLLGLVGKLAGIAAVFAASAAMVLCAAGFGAYLHCAPSAQLSLSGR